VAKISEMAWREAIAWREIVAISIRRHYDIIRRPEYSIGEASIENQPDGGIGVTKRNGV